MNAFTGLIDGYHRFRHRELPRRRDDWRTLGTGQTPGTMIISCVDSRVEPAQLFDTAPGEIFVHRNVANLVPTHDSSGNDGVISAIEFGVVGLGVRHIVILGHSGCGGIGACLAGKTDFASVDRWVELAAPARERVRGREVQDEQRALEEEAVRLSLSRLSDYPYVAERVSTGSLTLHGAHFDIGEARLSILDDATGEFLAE